MAKANDTHHLENLRTFSRDGSRALKNVGTW
jgi:hypothetical protein